MPPTGTTYDYLVIGGGSGGNKHTLLRYFALLFSRVVELPCSRRVLPDGQILTRI